MLKKTPAPIEVEIVGRKEHKSCWEKKAAREENKKSGTTL